MKRRIAQYEQKLCIYKQNNKIMAELLKKNDISYDMTLKMPQIQDDIKLFQSNETKEQIVAEKNKQ